MVHPFLTSEIFPRSTASEFSSGPRIVDSTDSVFLFIGVGRGGESPSSVRLVQSRRVQPTDDGFT